MLLMGGDLLPHYFSESNFITGYLLPQFSLLKDKMGKQFPELFLILGNDDAKRDENFILKGEVQGIWKYIHAKNIEYKNYNFFGYSYINPSPFLLKDWEKYDVSRYVEPGCISPEDGKRTIEIPEHEKKYSTIDDDLKKLFPKESIRRTICLFHAPPYQTSLDRAGLDGRKIEGVQLDVHVGSVAIKNWIEDSQPLLSLHGHIHESARLTGKWKDKVGKTHCFGAAHDGPELAIIKFNPNNLDEAKRILI